MKFFLAISLLFPFCAGAQDIPSLIRQEIAKTPNGEFLYKHSDGFRRALELRVAKKLGSRSEITGKGFAELPLAEGGSTIDVSNDEFSQQETSVAISRTDPRRIVITSNDDAMDVRSMPAYTTTDGGANWNTYWIPQVPPPYAPLGDPALIADNSGGFLYAFLLYYDASGLFNLLVTRSSDGTNWTYTAPIISDPTPGDLEDKPSMAIDRDPASPFYNRIYLSWLHIGPILDSCYLDISHSDDGGKTWSKPLAVVKKVCHFAQLKVGKGGKVFLVFSEYSEQDILVNHYFLTSTDGGASFTSDALAGFYNYPYYLGAGITLLKGANGFRAFPYVTYDCDAVTGAIDLVYATYGFAKGKRVAQLFYSRTTNEGNTWQTPVAVGFRGDSTALTLDRFHPWLVTDGGSGKSYLFYLSSERDPKNLLSAPYLWRIGKDDAGIPLDDSDFNPVAVRNFTGDAFIGDYTGADVFNKTFVSAWTENRKGSQDGDIYAFISSNIDSVTADVKRVQVSAKKLAIVSLYPNPSVGNKFAAVFAIPNAGEVKIFLTDESGRRVSNLLTERMDEGVYTKEFSTEKLMPGIYFLSIEATGESVEQKIILVKD